MTDDIYESMIQSRGRAYREAQIVDHSHYREPIDQRAGRVSGNSRVWGDASPEAQSRVIDSLIDASREAGLNARQTAHVLAIARVESGFNPDAAAGTTSASGLGQFVNRTGAHYGLNATNRFDLDAQAGALVSHYIDNLNLARSRGEGEEHVYKYHHDGPNSDYGGLAISRAEVTPYMDQYESFVRQRIGLAPGEPDPTPGVTTEHARTPSRNADALADDVLQRNERGQAVRTLQQNLESLGHTFEDAQGRRLAPTGFYGAQTEAAVRDFQGQAGLEQTGIADATTRRAIDEAVALRRDTPQPDMPTTQDRDGPRSFDAVMRTMLPPQAGVAPHITSDFGHRVINGRDDDHGGVDFNYVGGQNGANLRHPTVHSPVSGDVVFSGGQYGTVKIRDDQGNLHEILHLESRSVQATDPPQRVEAGDPIGTMGGRGPGGSGQYAQHVHYQVRDPQERLVDPERFWDESQNRTRNASGRTEPQPGGAFADGKFGPGDRGVGVEALQRQLDAAGYVGRDGKPLEPDARFGPNTGFAVSQLQQRHGLPATGEADVATLRVLADELAPQRANDTPALQRDAGSPATRTEPVQRTPLVSDPGHVDHPMYRSVLSQVHAQDQRIGRTPDAISERVAAGLTVEARARGLDSVGFVAFSPDGTRAFMTDARDPTAPWARTAVADVGKAAQQPIEVSTASLARIEAQQPSIAVPAPTHTQSEPTREAPASPRLSL